MAGYRKSIKPSFRFLIGISLVSFSTLMYEILITRIFSVTMFYHFAFLAVSVALLGMTIGATFIYFFKQVLTKYEKRLLPYLGILLAASMAIGIFVQLNLPFNPANPDYNSYIFLFNLTISLVPFIASGAIISYVIYKSTGDVNKVYAFDLGGAALGCVLVIFLLDFLGAPLSILFTAFAVSFSSILFLPPSDKKLKIISYSLTLMLAVITFLGFYLQERNKGFLTVRYAKGIPLEKPLFEKWNSFSRVSVTRQFSTSVANLVADSGKAQNEDVVPKLHMRIDADAYTPLYKFDGGLTEFEFLRHDISNLAHQIRKDAKVLIIGSGGGKDILSALVFGQERITAVEINNLIVSSLKNEFADFTGNLHKLPDVAMVNDEARSYLARSKEKYDIIQISLIDTWAATAAGAYTLSENSLYTQEAWVNFIKSLSGAGILSVTRWHVDEEPLETYRLIALASEALKKSGVEIPQNHLVIIKGYSLETPDNTVSLATLLVSKKPFTSFEISMLKEISVRDGYEVVYEPDMADRSLIGEIVNSDKWTTVSDRLNADISPPTDDRPFFFNMIRLKDVFNGTWLSHKTSGMSVAPVVTLIVTFVFVTFITLVFILLPLKLTKGAGKLKKWYLAFIYFGLIGISYMLIEVSQLQRLIVFLGRPTYSLSVVLFTLLTTSSLGSYFSKINGEKFGSEGVKKVLFLVITAILFGLIIPLISGYESSTPAIKILISIVTLAPLGFFMGMPFPLGIQVVAGKDKEIIPWLWGINGALSVYASVGAVVVALTSGISVSYWLGVLFYFLTLLIFILMTKKYRYNS